MNLKEKLKKLPSSPGVYLMKDWLNSIIYVGKSKNLRSRVDSYFQNLKSHLPDEAQIIYSYLKNKSNNCNYVIISSKWLNTENNVSIDNALNKLLLST